MFNHSFFGAHFTAAYWHPGLGAVTPELDPAPPERVYAIGHESRILKVAHENRTLAVPHEPRKSKISR